MYAGPNGVFSGEFPYTAGLGVFCMTLEKSSTLAQSGSPISASRDLRIDIGPVNISTYLTGSVKLLGQVPAASTPYSALTDVKWNGMYLVVFVPYVCLCTVFLDSILVRS